jgi:spermidine/putrescine transport system permease protein
MTRGAAAAARGGGFAALLSRRPAVGPALLLAPTLLVMAAGVLVPFVTLLALSVWTREGFGYDTTPTLANYARAVDEPIFGAFLWRSLGISGVASLVTVLLCYPVAYYVAFHVHRHKMLWLIVVTLPFWTSYLLRVFAWRVILGYEGVINSALISLGLIAQPLEFLLYSRTAVVVTLAHAWAAFAILPLYVSLEKIDRALLEAAADLGDPPSARFLRIVLPLSTPGLLAAFFLIFIPTTGDYITPALLGGPDGAMIGNLIQLQFGAVNNWPMGAALAAVLTLWIGAIALVSAWLARRLRSPGA